MKKIQINTVPKNEDIKSMLIGIHFSIQIVKCLHSVTWSGLNVVIVNNLAQRLRVGTFFE